jgi:hypothetical protein
MPNLKDTSKLYWKAIKGIWAEVIAPCILIGTLGYAAGIKSGELYVLYMGAAVTVYARTLKAWKDRPEFHFTIQHHVSLPPSMDPEDFRDAFEGTRFTLTGLERR